MPKHPRKLGFELGLKIRIGQPTSITRKTDSALKVRNVVYVALLGQGSRMLKRGEALKIGQAKGSLISRWKGIVGIFNPDRKLRDNEKEDCRKWLAAANGKMVSVWMKRAGKCVIPYAKGLTRSRFSTRAAEEEFLDEYYQPKLGIPLNRNSTDEVS
jgi:hypothetical protein